MSGYVTLQYPRQLRGEEYFSREYVCDTLGKAIGALDELGLCMNWAILTKLESGSTFLLYEGWAYRQTWERYVMLPFESRPDFGDIFEKLLRDIFTPFLKDTQVHHSSIQLRLHPEEENCYFVHIFLVLGEDHTHDEAFSALEMVEDGHEEAGATVFWLD